MSQEPKNNEEGFMYKLASFIVDKRNLIFLIVAIGLVFSAFSRNWVQVENQLSAYLPKDSETYKGLHLMEDEFITFGTAKIMLVNVTYDEAQAVSERLEAVDGVQSVTFDDTKEHYTNASALYNITFDYSETDDMCETVMERVEDELSGYDMYVSATFGDTASKTLAQEIGVIVIIVAIVVVSVLILTSQTYAEVPVLLITFIAAALLNMGTNFLLGTISFVSNSVTIVLQLALSVDYAIIFCNRYKEEHEKLPIREAVIVALSKAVPEICGGLVAMLFMEFRLGFDLGVCLIKSIFFSLFAVFFLMPGLLMLFGKKIDATRHKNFVPKIPFVGRFAYATKKIIPPIFLVVIIVAMLFANNCPYVYGFSYLETTKHSEQQIADDLMDDTFGSTNMVAVVVPAGDYAAEKKLLDELGTYDEVDSTMGLTNMMFYILVYVFSNLGVFAVIAAIENKTGKVGMDDYNGLHKTNPWLSFAMTLAVFSLAGIPPFAGFFSKFFIFTAATQSGSVALYVLVLIALINTIISLYYYLLVVKAMWISKEEPVIEGFRSTLSERCGIWICVAGIVFIGLVSCIYQWLETSSQALAGTLPM